MEKLSPFHQHRYLPLVHVQNLPERFSPPKLHASAVTSTFLETQSGHLQPVLLSCASSKYAALNDLHEIKSLAEVKIIHSEVIKLSQTKSSDIMVKDLITCYLKFTDFRSAATVFLTGLEKNYQFLSIFLEEFRIYGGNVCEILETFSELHSKTITLDSSSLTIILKLCVSVMDVWLGLEIHAYFIKTGFDMDTYMKCALTNFYGSCWGLESAEKIFNEMLERDVLLWNEVISVNMQNGRSGRALELFQGMQHLHVQANNYTIVKLLQACSKLGALKEGKQIHGYVYRFSHESSLSVSNSLINMYSKNDEIELGRKVFDSMKDRDLSSWNSIISGNAALGYLDDAWNLVHEMDSLGMKPDIVTWNSLLSGHSHHGYHTRVLLILRRMQALGFKPNSNSITSTLQAVSELNLLNIGKEIHGYVIRNGLHQNVYVGTSLLDMNLKTNRLIDARAIFDGMEDKNIFTWNSMIMGYSLKGHFEEALSLFNQMEDADIRPDLVTWNGLISGYSMRGHHMEAMSVIHLMKGSGLKPNVVSWTALISGCTQKENYKEAQDFFILMQEDGVKPNSATISCILCACAGLSLMQKGREIHCFSIRNGFNDDIFVSTSLIDMYAKSGSLKNAVKIFRMTPNKTLACWNSMITGMGIYGRGKEGTLLLEEMHESGITPDAITFTAALSACKNGGLVVEGWEIFDKMRKEYKISPTIEHYSCMVDLLGKCGYLDEALDLIQTMPVVPDATMWGALLGSCRIHKNLEISEIAAKELFKLEPNNSANYALLMNVYSVLNRWGDVGRLKDLMDSSGLKTQHVWSWIQIDQRVHVFSTEDKSHPEAGEIYFELYKLVSEIKLLGYVPDIECVYQNIEDGEKEKVLLSHTEKLAITYGLIKMKGHRPIRVIRNARICPDCHTAAKYVSLARKREILIKDTVRFHHFVGGKCSCNDYW